MKKYIRLISFCLIFLITPFVSAIDNQLMNDNSYSKISDVKNNSITEENSQENKTKKNDSIDGTTSASQLRAKKSHYVSETNETILTVALGIISISLIIFFLKLLGNRK